MELMNFASLSEVITAETPKIWIQVHSRTFTHSSAVVDWRGICSDHLYAIIMMVKIKVYPQN